MGRTFEVSYYRERRGVESILRIDMIAKDIAQAKIFAERFLDTLFGWCINEIREV